MSFLGKGIFKGMAVTLKNFALSYVDRGKKERLPTVQYPEEGNTVTPFTRNFPFLIFDGEDEIDGMRCVACQICERECPPACIYIVKEKDENGKFVKRPKVFDIDVSVCMGCQICVEVCPFDAIVMDSEFEYSKEDRFGALLFDRDQLLKSNDYYHKIHPDEARDRDANLAAKKAADEAKKKAREEKAAAAAAAKAAAAEKETQDQKPSTEESDAEPKREDASPARKPTNETEAKGSDADDSKSSTEVLESSSPAPADSAESQSPESCDAPPQNDEPEKKKDAP
jgi:NADH-quinone oxidoreductase subunit I